MNNINYLTMGVWKMHLIFSRQFIERFIIIEIMLRMLFF